MNRLMMCGCLIAGIAAAQENHRWPNPSAGLFEDKMNWVRGNGGGLGVSYPGEGGLADNANVEGTADTTVASVTGSWFGSITILGEGRTATFDLDPSAVPGMSGRIAVQGVEMANAASAIANVTINVTFVSGEGKGYPNADETALLLDVRSEMATRIRLK